MGHASQVKAERISAATLGLNVRHVIAVVRSVRQARERLPEALLTCAQVPVMAILPQLFEVITF